ncbi:hypothetical protein M8C13_36225 [Crossiella sp. SN42]|uniref:hypothetical protein n=1 Tax=Crossiella sp. SN42 TaxID=2944808 RepID=UPI00207D0B55|nr:hypothetical protein [Crossiella sp. SN42]MCO1581211.1 hypothetical protein [Crossiella sp. SN42]
MSLPAAILLSALAALAFTSLVPPLANLASLGLVGLAVGYVAACRFYPLRPCPACGGDSVQRSRGVFGGIRACPACAGTGTRLRRGVRLWQWLRRRTHRRR